MVSYRNSNVVLFSRYINKDTKATVLAFQFTEENLDHLRVLWKQPDAKPGDWLVKVAIGTLNPQLKLIHDEHFHHRFRLPVGRQPRIVETEESWNAKYAHMISSDEED